MGGYLRILLAISSMYDCLARQVRFKNKTKIFKCLQHWFCFYCQLLQRQQEGQRGGYELFIDKPSRIKYTWLFYVLFVHSS